MLKFQIRGHAFRDIVVTNTSISVPVWEIGGPQYLIGKLCGSRFVPQYAQRLVHFESSWQCSMFISR